MNNKKRKHNTANLVYPSCSKPLITHRMKQIKTKYRFKTLGISLLIFLGVLFFSEIKAQESFVLNFSEKTECAEVDNINIPIYEINAQNFKIIATHPTYPFSQEDCEPNFDNCDIGSGGNPDQCETIYDDGTNVIKTCIVDNWWKDTTMTVELNNGISKQAHYIVLVKKISDADSWPEFFVLYQDGNLRLIPHPPVDVQSVCYGSSVIVGPADQDSIRPFVEIDKIEITPSNLELFVSYTMGGDATLSTFVDRDSAVVDISINYSRDFPIATFRSMWIEDGNCDVDYIAVGNNTVPIFSSWDTIAGSSFFFHRKYPSIHNNSSPDIRIKVDKITNSINQARLERDEFYIYPNPSENTISVGSYEDYKIDVLEIISVEGKIVKKIYSNFQSIELSGLKAGIYFIKIISGDKSITKKIIKS